ncbi:MAG: energy-coupling factor transporter ATPase [Clostridia bacterium]|nr:energy-coupling factor transporter ATPase [Clostridia bacterium]
MSAIVIDNVTFGYDKKSGDVLKSVSLQIEEGEFVCVVGRNGSGKSTLAKTINGLLTPSEGSIKVFGVDTKEESTIFDVRKNVGMVFQNPDNQMVASIVEDDVAFGPENLGIPREEIKARIDWALKAVGMEEYRHGTPNKLSGGQKQRIAIAGVLALKPRVLVLDEATAMLDPRGRREVMDTVRELNKKENITVIHITHYMEECVGADRVVVVDGGEIVMQGRPEEVFSKRSELSTYQLGLPPVMALADMLRERGVEIGVVHKEDELVEELCRLL